eukprot:gene21553-28546_t
MSTLMATYPLAVREPATRTKSLARSMSMHTPPLGPGASSKVWSHGPHGRFSCTPRQAVRVTEAASSSSTVEVEVHGGQGTVAAMSQAESLEVLEWPAVCKQVACFAQTVMAAQQLARGGLPIGGSLEESMLLLQETAEAKEANLTLSAVFDLSAALAEATSENGYLNAKQLEGVGKSIEAALQAKAQVGGGKFPALEKLADGIRVTEVRIAQAIRKCIQAIELEAHGSSL